LDLVECRGGARYRKIWGSIEVRTNFEIGRRIVEREQKGVKRAEYGKEMLKELSLRLTDEFGRGFSVSNLQFMRQLFLQYSDRIQEMVSVELIVPAKQRENSTGVNASRRYD
jgi:hypothetical protein